MVVVGAGQAVDAAEHLGHAVDHLRQRERVVVEVVVMVVVVVSVAPGPALALHRHGADVRQWAAPGLQVVQQALERARAEVVGQSDRLDGRLVRRGAGGRGPVAPAVLAALPVANARHDGRRAAGGARPLLPSPLPAAARLQGHLDESRALGQHGEAPRRVARRVGRPVRGERRHVRERGRVGRRVVERELGDGGGRARLARLRGGARPGEPGEGGVRHEERRGRPAAVQRDERVPARVRVERVERRVGAPPAPRSVHALLPAAGRRLAGAGARAGRLIARYHGGVAARRVARRMSSASCRQLPALRRRELVHVVLAG